VNVILEPGSPLLERCCHIFAKQRVSLEGGSKYLLLCFFAFSAIAASALALVWARDGLESFEPIAERCVRLEVIH
jgi:hypothetical protein